MMQLNAQSYNMLAEVLFCVDPASTFGLKWIFMGHVRYYVDAVAHLNEVIKLTRFSQQLQALPPFEATLQIFLTQCL